MAQPLAAVPKPAISADERARRQKAVNSARASIGLEGFKVSAEEERHSQRFIDGEIDLAEYVKVQRGPNASR